MRHGAGQIFFREIKTISGFRPYKTSMSTLNFPVASAAIGFLAVLRGLGQRALATRRARLTVGVCREALIWLLVCLVALQAPGLVSAELRGPAHYHDSSPGNLPDHSKPADHAQLHPHRHSDVERHHHGAADEPIPVDDEVEHQHDAMAIDEGANGSGSQFNLTALLLHNPSCGLPEFGHARPACAQKALHDRSLGRIDRPPAPKFG